MNICSAIFIISEAIYFIQTIQGIYTHFHYDK